MSGTLSHAELMDTVYRHQRQIYDVTRRYYLLGRDRLVAELDAPPGARVLEIACGTGRNLSAVARRYPDAALYGVDISREMLRSSRAKLGNRARLAYADACDFDARALFGVPGFDRVILSYSLSMIPDWQRALAVAADQLAPAGSLHVVDFGRQHALPGWFRNGLNAWLGRFHVSPRHDLHSEMARLAVAQGMGIRFADLHRSYAQSCVLTRPA